jgi:hypothetical protein
VQKARAIAGFSQLSMEIVGVGCPSGNFPGPDYLIRLRPLLALNDVEFHVIALLQALVSIHLNRAVVDEHIRPVVPADKTVAFRIVEPLHLAFVLSHKREPSSQADFGWVTNLLSNKDAVLWPLGFLLEYRKRGYYFFLRPWLRT